MSTRVFLITGATGRLGESVIGLLGGRGDRLLLTGRNKDRLAELEQRYGAAGRIETLAVDVSDPAGARLAAEEAVRRFARLDGLVHLVGGFRAWRAAGRPTVRGPSPAIP